LIVGFLVVEAAAPAAKVLREEVPMTPPSEPEPILRVTVGSPIYTRDERKIGTVKERQGRAFKVGTSFLQRDYWLNGDILASATPDGAVYLALDQAQVEKYKLKAPPA
jgi:hypothetical protein